MTSLGREGRSRRMVRDGAGLRGEDAGASRIVLRTRSRQAYAFETHPREAVSDLGEIGAVYAYARAIPANTSDTTVDDSGAGLDIGYIGKTDNMSLRDADHRAHGHFVGQGFDIVLILRSEDAPLRADIQRDLVETFDPVLNDLLRGLEPGETC